MTNERHDGHVDEHAELQRLLAEHVQDYAIFVVDPQRRVRTWTPGAQRLLGYPHDEIVGHSADVFFIPEDIARGAPEREIEQALATGRGADDRWHVRRDGSWFWANGSVTPLWTSTGELRGFAKIMRDCTERKLQESRGAVQLDVTETLAEARSIEQAAPKVLRDICAGLAWDVGAFWLVDPSSKTLHCLHIWDSAAVSQPQSESGAVAAISRAGQDLAEQAWRSGSAIWISDVAAEPHQSELAFAAEAGLHGALTIPLQIGGEVLGVLQTFNRMPRARDTELQRVMAALGGHLGQFIQRKHIEESLRASEERFRGLMEQAPFSIQVFAADGRSLQVNRAWEQLWGIPAARNREYNVLNDPQLDAQGASDSIRRAFAGEPVEVPAVEYDPLKTMPDLARGQEARRWVSAVAYPLKDPAGQVREVILVHLDITARTRAEDALRDSEERYRGIVTHSIAGVAEVDLDGRYLFANQRYCEIIGRPVEELLGLTMQQISHPEDLVSNLALFERLAREGVPFVIEKRYVRPDGSHIWVNNSVSGLRGRDGQIQSIVAVCVDITARRQAEEAHREGEERLRLALEAGRMGTWSWDVRSNDVRWSPHLESIHGLEPGTFPGTFDAYLQDIHPEDRQRVVRSLLNAAEHGTEHHLEYRLVWPDGSIHWIEARGKLVRDEVGQPKQMLGVCVEISERKRKEQDLQFLAEASRSLATLVDYQSTLQQIATLAVPHFADGCAIYVPDESGELQRLAIASAASADLPAIDKLTQPGPLDLQTFGGIHDVYRTGRSVLLDRLPISDASDAADGERSADGLMTRGVASYMCVPMMVRDHAIGVIAFIGAVGKRHYTDADLALAEDLAHRAAIASENARLYEKIREEGQRKDEFLAMLAHELRNPLAPIRSGLDLLHLMGADHTIVNTMQHQIEHLVRLVDDLLDVSRIMRGKIELRREPVELSAVVQRASDTVAGLIQSNHQQFSLQLPLEPIWLDADAVRLAQVIGNLLNNASKYTPQAGRIELHVAHEGDQAVIRVRDNGIGITPQLLPHIFELFTQDQRTIDRAQGGLGIGLTVVSNLVEMHGGTVTAASEGRGRGSEFVVRLPTLATHPNMADASQARHAAAPLRILVVDDNVSAAQMLSILLRKLGDHTVVAAHDGVAAIAAAKQHRPDLILLDIGLPKLDGFEVARQLRLDPEFRKTHIAALTGYGTLEDRRKSLSAGFNDHLVKPLAVDELQKILADAKAARQ